MFWPILEQFARLGGKKHRSQMKQCQRRRKDREGNTAPQASGLNINLFISRHLKSELYQWVLYGDYLTQQNVFCCYHGLIMSNLDIFSFVAVNKISKFLNISNLLAVLDKIVSLTRAQSVFLALKAYPNSALRRSSNCFFVR